MDDPVSALNRHYQKKISTSNLSLKQQFHYFSSKTINGALFWRCVFTCPLTKETFETTHHSENSKKEGIHVEGNYYLPSKKKAQKSAALCVLHKIMNVQNIVENDEWNHTHIDSGDICRNKINKSNEKSVLTDLKTPDQDISPSLPLSPSHWIHNLYAYGVSSESINVSFQEDEQYMWKLQKQNNHKHQEELSFLCDHQNPTMILCTLQMEHPIRITVTGKPKSSKKEATKSAAAMIEKEMIQQNIQKIPLTIKCDDIDDEIQKRRQKKLQINQLRTALLPKTCSLYYPLPPYLTNEIKLDQTLILYEIVLEGNQYPWVCMRNNRKKKLNSCLVSSKTRMGILFPSMNVEPKTTNIQKDDDTIQSTFRLPFPLTLSNNNAYQNESEDVQILIKLIHRTHVTKNTITQEQLHQIQQFNRILLTESKQYGLHNATNSRQNRNKMFNKGVHYDGVVSRSYLFVPLLDQTTNKFKFKFKSNSQSHDKNMMIDWKLVSDIVYEKVKPLISPLDFFLSSRYIPYIGYLDCLFISFTFFLLAILLLIPFFNHLILLQNTIQRFEYIVNSITTCLMEQNVEEYCGYGCILLSFLFYVLHHLQRPTWNLSKEILHNRFMIQINAASINAILYIYNPPDDKSCNYNDKNCTSPFLPSNADLTQSKQDYNIRKFNLDLRTATFGDYYRKKYGYIARFPNAKLLPVKSLTKHSSFDPTKPKSVEDQSQTQLIDSSTKESNGIFILPELVKVLPMPRDLLYTFQYVNTFMPILERELELRHIQHFLLAMDSIFQSKGQNLEINILHSESKNDAKEFFAFYDSRSFLSLLRDATTIRPCVMYDTLEFVGDAVLSFFLAINLFSLNAQLDHDVDDLEEIKNEACRNKCLADRGLYCGIHRLIHGGQFKWQHVVVNSSSLQNRECTKMSVNDKHIADVTEALLGVLFLGCDTLDQASIKIISFLELLNLPLSDKMEDRQMQCTNWFMSTSSCLTTPYNFHLDPFWLQQLHQAEATLNPSNQNMFNSKTVLNFEKLEIGISNLFNILNIVDESDQEKSRTLLLVALFDDSLENESIPISSEQTCVTMEYEHKSNKDLEETSDLIKVALFRDSLFIIGNAVLHLVLSAELFTRYPTATAGDLHLLRVCGGDCDDLLVYIMIKNGIHLSLYDNSNKILHKLIQEIGIADLIGKKRWNTNGGWLLENGIEEFQTRKAKALRWLQLPNDYKSELIDAYPKYIGLSGGRLAGKRDKLSSKFTDELSFSMKVSN